MVAETRSSSRKKHEQSDSSSAATALGLTSPATDPAAPLHAHHKREKPSLKHQIIDLIFSVTGIYVCYIVYAIYQERLTTTLQPDGTRFSHTLFLMFIQCIFNCLCIWPILRYKFPSASDEHPSSHHMKQHQYALLAFTYMCGMITSYEALAFINYPTSVLIKSCKMLPVMLIGWAVYRQRYSAVEYAAVAMITLGIYMFFVYKEGKHDESVNNTGMGVLLSGISLTMDGLTGSSQDRYVSQYHPSSERLMYEMNKWAIVELFVLCSVTGQGVAGMNYVMHHTHLIGDLCIFGVVSAIGQLFIFHMVIQFGALTLCITTSTRKFFTILASVIYFKHHMQLEQWAGVVLVFVGLGVDIWRKTQKKRREHKKEGDADKEKEN